MATSDIGTRIKVERQRQGVTLKALSQETGLSVGFLSQFERGISSIAVDSFMKIARVLNLPASALFADAQTPDASRVVRTVEQRPKVVSSQIYQFILSHDVTGFSMLPRMYLLMPRDSDEEIELYNHEGEEFIYVLEGVITMCVGDEKHLMYPGDSIQIHSLQPHNWINHSNNIARILTINLPNPFLAAGAETPSEG